MPDLYEPQYIVKEVAIKDGEIVGLGSIRLTSEVLTILNLDLPAHLRANAVDSLMQVGIHKSQKFGIDETHCFLTGDLAHGFAKYLKRHLGFEDCPGLALTLRY
jgi:hypothetical protein